MARFEVTGFGAVGNGEALDTGAIQAAIDACAAAGGGTVVLPPGRFCSGTLRLCSHLRLQLEAGSVLQASDDLANYETDGVPLGLLYAEEQETEKGTLPFVSGYCSGRAK